MTPFEIGAAFVLAAEGYHSHDSVDPGGETWWGISRVAHPEVEPWPPSREQALAIYRNRYWDALSCDALPPGVALVTFDCAVNQGARVAARVLQRACKVRDDGVVGPVTIAAAHGQPEDVVERMATERVLRYVSTKNFDRYGRGWVSRVIRVVQRAAEVAAKEPT